MINFNETYVFSDADKKTALHLRSKNGGDFEKILKEGLKEGEVQEYIYLQGSKPLDIIACGTAINYLISSKVYDILKGNGITGWKIYNVKATGKNGIELEGYYGLSIVGRCGPITVERSEIKLMPPRVPWAQPYKVRMGYYFEESSWDGSDFFSPEASFQIFTTEKVKILMEENKVSNLEFKRITEVENLSNPFEFR